MTEKLTPKKIEVFASDAQAETLPFGGFDKTSATKDPDALQANALAIDGGWAKSVQPRTTPDLAHFNALQFLTTRKLKEFQQQGVPEHIDDETYHKGSIVRKRGTYELYGCKENNVKGVLPNIDGDNNWKFLANIADIGGMKEWDAKDKVYYGMYSDQYQVKGNPVYNENDKSHTLDGVDDCFKTIVELGHAKTFELITKVNFNDRSTPNVIWGSFSEHFNPFQVEVSADGKIRFWASSGSTNYDIANAQVGSDVLNINADYWFKAKKTETQYIISYSTDGSVWKDQITVTNSKTIFNATKLMIGVKGAGTDQLLNGKVWLKETTATVNGIQVLKPETNYFVKNTYVWSGKVRSSNNSVDISSVTPIRSTEMFNAITQYADDGRRPPYNPDNYSLTMGAENVMMFIATPDSGIFASDDFEITNRVSLSTNTNEPIFVSGSGSSNNKFVVRIVNGIANVWVSSNNTSWDITDAQKGSKYYTVSTEYDYRFAKSPTGYILQYSENKGQSWIDDVDIVTNLKMNGTVSINVVWGGDYTPNPDIFMHGTMYLEGMSLFANGKQIIRPQNDTGIAPSEDVYGFVGFDKDNNVKFELTGDITGNSLKVITGSKRGVLAYRVSGDGELTKYITKTNSDGSLFSMLQDDSVIINPSQTANYTDYILLDTLNPKGLEVTWHGFIQAYSYTSTSGNRYCGVYVDTTKLNEPRPTSYRVFQYRIYGQKESQLAINDLITVNGKMWYKGINASDGGKHFVAQQGFTIDRRF